MFKYLRKGIFFSLYLLESSDFQSIGHDKYISGEKSKASTLVLGHPAMRQNITSLSRDLKFPYSKNILKTCFCICLPQNPKTFFGSFQQSTTVRTRQELETVERKFAKLLRTPTTPVSEPLGLNLALAVGQDRFLFLTLRQQ